MQFQFLRHLPLPLEQFLYFFLIVVVVGAVSMFLGESIPRRWYRYDAFPYICYRWERGGAIYEKMGVRKWKDRVPDMSKYMKFIIDKRISGSRDAQSMKRLIQETCNGEFVHWVLLLLSPMNLIFLKGGYGVLATVIYALFNVPFIIIQRYNRPRLVVLLNRMTAQPRRRGE